jgi:hypothetical protein
MFIVLHLDLRLLWAIVTVTAKLYFLCLLVAAIYSTSVSIRTASRLRRLPKDATSTGTRDGKAHLIKMTRGIETLRQFHILLFLLFGIVCANEIFATLRTIRLFEMSLSGASINVFEPVAAFAFCVFVVFIFLHIFQWIVMARLQSYCPFISKHAYLRDD